MVFQICSKMSSFQELDPPVGVGFRVPTPLFLVSISIKMIRNN